MNSQSNRREFLTGAAAAAIAGPAAIRDGVALGSMTHPLSSMATQDLTEASLLRMVVEVRRNFIVKGHDAFGNPISETITI